VPGRALLPPQDELLQLALARWLLEYWNQPTDFTWEDFLPMIQVRQSSFNWFALHLGSLSRPLAMQHTLSTMRDELAESVRPSVKKLQDKLSTMDIDKEMVSAPSKGAVGVPATP
jgi:hypothetical protein